MPDEIKVKVIEKQNITVIMDDNNITLTTFAKHKLDITEEDMKLTQNLSPEYTDICIITPPIIHLDSGDLETKEAICGENVNAGDFVYFYYENDTLMIKKAIATSKDTIAHGFVLVDEVEGNRVTVYCEGINDKLQNLQVGMTYFLSYDNAGKISIVAPQHGVVQKLGVAVSQTELSFERSQIIIRN